MGILDVSDKSVAFACLVEQNTSDRMYRKKYIKIFLRFFFFSHLI